MDKFGVSFIRTIIVNEQPVSPSELCPQSTRSIPMKKGAYAVQVFAYRCLYVKPKKYSMIMSPVKAENACVTLTGLQLA